MPDAARINRSAKCGRRVSILVILLFLLQMQALWADSRADLHKRILAGEQISLARSAPEGARTIDANWIKEAVSKQIRVEIYRAVIKGRLDLHDTIVQQEFTLGECVVN